MSTTVLQKPERIRVETYSYIIISGSICQIETRQRWLAHLNSHSLFVSQQLTYRSREDPGRIILLYLNFWIRMPDRNQVGMGSRFRFTLTIRKSTIDLQKPDRIRVGTCFRFLISIYKCQVGPCIRFTFILKTYKSPTDSYKPYKIRVESYSYIIISESICQIGTIQGWVRELKSP